MSDFRSLLEEINEAVAKYDEIDAALAAENGSLAIAQGLVSDLRQALAEKERELSTAQDAVDQLKEKQVAIMKVIWDTESEMHALMPEDYKAESVPEPPSSEAYQRWGS